MGLESSILKKHGPFFNKKQDGAFRSLFSSLSNYIYAHFFKNLLLFLLS